MSRNPVTPGRKRRLLSAALSMMLCGFSISSFAELRVLLWCCSACSSWILPALTLRHRPVADDGASLWFGMGIWYGWGYCICTRWRWRGALQLRRGCGPNIFINAAFTCSRITGRRFSVAAWWNGSTGGGFVIAEPDWKRRSRTLKLCRHLIICRGAKSHTLSDDGGVAVLMPLWFPVGVASNEV